MRLIYIGKNGQWINGVPARDLESHEVQKIAKEWGKSLAETEGLLIQRGLYKVEKPVPVDTDKADTAPDEIIPKKKSRKEDA